MGRLTSYLINMAAAVAVDIRIVAVVVVACVCVHLIATLNDRQAGHQSIWSFCALSTSQPPHLAPEVVKTEIYIYDY